MRSGSLIRCPISAVMPAKAGISVCLNACRYNSDSAFAGMTRRPLGGSSSTHQALTPDQGEGIAIAFAQRERPELADDSLRVEVGEGRHGGEQCLGQRDAEVPQRGFERS